MPDSGSAEPAAKRTSGGTVTVMPQHRSSSSEPEPPVVDDALAGLRKLAGLAKELGVNDVATFTDAIEAARNDGRGAEFFKPLKALVEQLAGQSDNPRSFTELGARLKGLVSTRETVFEVRAKVEIALLRRIEELSVTAPIEGVVDLATAYARVCASGQVPAGTTHGAQLDGNSAAPQDG